MAGLKHKEITEKIIGGNDLSCENEIRAILKPVQIPAYQQTGVQIGDSDVLLHCKVTCG